MQHDELAKASSLNPLELHGYCLYYLQFPFPKGLNLKPVRIIANDGSESEINGGVVWNSVPVMLWWLWQQLPRLQGKTVMELGGGLAVPSQMLSQLGVATRVVATDTDSLLLQRLHNSVQDDARLDDQTTPLEVWHLNWAAPAQVSVLGAGENGKEKNAQCKSESKVDIIIGTDIIYRHDHLQDLALTMVHWLEMDGRAFLINNRNRSEQAGFDDIISATPGLELESVTPLSFPSQYARHGISNGLSGSEILATGRLADLEFTLLEIRRS
jgi:predicted nicotinamide N-methyase